MRYAIYFTPPANDALLKVAANWLGRDAFSGELVKMPAIRSLATDEILKLTEEPRRYGFHATLKAPFRLHEDYTESDLLSALMYYASSTSPVMLPRLKLRSIGPFFALTPAKQVPELNQLANDVVVALDRFRAPLSSADMARRKPDQLSQTQRRNLERWGYPYVFEEFRFHMTLTGKVDENDRPRIERSLNAFFEPVLEGSVDIANLALFVEPETGAPFEIHSLHPLTGGNQLPIRTASTVGRL